jgi:hypothetical protein
MLTAYCDDSGTDAARRTAVVAGYLATDIQWERFALRWTPLLDAYGVSRLHRVDLESFKREFKKWNPDRRKEFLVKAHRIIKRHTYVGFGTGVIKGDFEEVMPSWVKDMFGGVYGWCANECIVHIAKWCQRKSYKERIPWIFERGTSGHGYVSALFETLSKHSEWGERHSIGTCRFQDKRTIPLQAADTLAYEVFKHLENRIIDEGKRDVRLSALDLVRPGDEPYLKYWDKARMARWLESARRKGINKFL